MVLVLGQIRQVTEIGEGANHADRLFAAQRCQPFFQSRASLCIRIASERDRQSADLLDQRKRFFTFLLANHITQNAAQPAYIVYQRSFMVRDRVTAARRWRFAMHTSSLEMGVTQRENHDESPC